MNRTSMTIALGLALATVPGHPSAQSALEQLGAAAGTEDLNLSEGIGRLNRRIASGSEAAARRVEIFSVKARMLDMKSGVDPRAQLLAPGTAAEFTVTVHGDRRDYGHLILLTIDKVDGNLYQIEADASQAGYPCRVVPAKQFFTPGSKITVTLEPERGYRSQYRMRLSVSRAAPPIELLSDEQLQKMLDNDRKDFEAIQKKANETKKKLRELKRRIGSL